MGQSATRLRESGEKEAESASGDSSHEEESVREKEQEEETEPAAPLVDGRGNAFVDAANDAAEDSDPDRVELVSTNAVDYDTGPDRETLAQRYGMAVGEREATAVHRLESEFGPDRVQRWADEGMPVQTMGKPRDMAAFRQRQESRPDAVPADIERQNEHSVQRSAEAAAENGPAGEAGVPEVVRKVISKPGQPLPDDVRKEMEEKLGEDFSDVQIHTGSEAAAAADALSARAFTVGNHIVFNDGEYKPETDEGKEILAHELTHVRQQNGDVSKLPAEGGMVVDPDPQQEKEAEQIGKEVQRDADATVQQNGSDVHVQRSPIGTAEKSQPIQREGEEESNETESTEDSDETEAETARVADVNSNGESVGSGVSIRRMAANASFGTPEEASFVSVQREGEKAESAEETDAAEEESETERVADINNGEKAESNRLSIHRLAGNGATESGGYGQDLAIQREAATAERPSSNGPNGAESQESEDGENNVKDHHEIIKGDTLSEIAASYGLDDWKNIWYHNYDVVGDTPNIIFPDDTLEIPEDEDAVPDLDLKLESEEQMEAPEKDLREEGAEARKPDEPAVDEAEIEDPEPPQEGENEPEQEKDEDADTEGSDGLAIQSSAEVETEEPPAMETESPSQHQEDKALQQGSSEVVSEVETTVNEDVCGDQSEPLSPNHAENAQAASEAPEAEEEGAAGAAQLEQAQTGLEEGDSFDLDDFEDRFMDRIEAATPETMEAIESYEEDEPLEDTEEEIQADIESEHSESAGPVEEAVDEDPDPSTVQPADSDELERPDAGNEPEVASDEMGEGMATKPRSEEEVEGTFEAEEAALDEPREAAGFEDEDPDLTESPNEELREVGEAETEVRDQCQQAPDEYRAVEEETQEQARARAQQEVEETTEEVHEQRETKLTAIAERKEAAKEADEGARESAWSRIQNIIEDTQQTVDENLEEMERKEAETIERISERRQEFEEEVSEIAEEESGFFSGIVDFFTSGDFMDRFEEKRKAFLKDVKENILADLISTVGECMENIERAISEGREEIEKVKEDLKDEREDLCDETLDDIDAAFGEMEQSATERTTEMSDSVVESYEEELAKADEHLAQKKEEVEASRRPVQSWLAEKWGELKEIAEMGLEVGRMYGEIMLELWIPPWEFPLLDLLQNKIDFWVEAGKEFGEDWKQILFDGLFEFLNLDMLGDADIELPKEGFEDFWEFAKFTFSIGQALIGGVLDYALTRAEQVWGNETVDLKNDVGLSDDMIKNSELIEGNNSEMLLTDLVSILLEKGGDLLDWAIEVGGIIASLFGPESEEEDDSSLWSQLLEDDAFEKAIDVMGVINNLIINVLQSKLLDAAINKLMKLLGPAAAIIGAAKKIFDLLEFIFDNAMGIAAIIQGVVKAVHGLVVTNDVSDAVDIFMEFASTIVATLLSFMASLAGSAGKASDKVTDAIVSLKEKADNKIDDILMAKKKPIKKGGVMAFKPLVLASGRDEEEESSDEEVADAQEEGEDTDDAEDDESAWQRAGQHASAVEDRVDDLIIDTPIPEDSGETVDSMEIEQKIMAAEIVIEADESGSVAERDASRAIRISGLQDVHEESGTDADIFVLEHATTIRDGLIESIAKLAGKDDPSEVWENGEWKYDHETVAQQAAGEAAEMAYEDGIADLAGGAGAALQEEYGDRVGLGEERLSAKMRGLEAEQQLEAEARDMMAANDDVELSDNAYHQLARESDVEELEEITGMSVAEADARNRLEESAYERAKDSDVFDTGDLTDRELRQEIAQMDDEMLDATAGREHADAIRERQQILDEASDEVTESELFYMGDMDSRDVFEGLQEMDDDTIEAMTGERIDDHVDPDTLETTLSEQRFSDAQKAFEDNDIMEGVENYQEASEDLQDAIGGDGELFGGDDALFDTEDVGEVSADFDDVQTLRDVVRDTIQEEASLPASIIAEKSKDELLELLPEMRSRNATVVAAFLINEYELSKEEGEKARQFL